MGEWAAWGAPHPSFGRITAALPNASYDIHVFEVDHMRRLHETDRVERRVLDPTLHLGVAWQGFSSVQDQRHADAVAFGHADAASDPPRKVWRWQGLLSRGALNLSTSFLITDTTLREPRSTPFSLLRNRHIYAALVARLFRTGDAFPTSFNTGEWRALFPDQATEADVRLEASLAFTLSRTPCLPLRVQQRVYQLASGGLPIGPRTGSTSLTAGCCPTCVASGRWIPHTHEHLILACPLALRLWQSLLHSWHRSFPRQQWVLPLTQARSVQPNDPSPALPLDTRRALCLGLLPPSQRQELAQPFALLRGAVLAVLLLHHWRAERLTELRGVDPSSSPASRNALVVQLRTRVVQEIQHAVRCERVRAVRSNSIILAAGCDLGPDNDALVKWRRVWVRSGVCQDCPAATLMVFRWFFL